MADAKITQLTALTTASTDDILPIVDSPGASPVTKKITLANLNASLGAIGQIPFPATQSASSDVNTLDDYEEGTWTPVLTMATPGDRSVAYSLQAGSYVKIGGLVFASCAITTTTWTWTTASGLINITGWPFTAKNENPVAVGEFYGAGWTQANAIQTWLQIINNTTTGRILYSKSGGATDQFLVAADMPSGTQQKIVASIVYRALA